MFHEKYESTVNKDIAHLLSIFLLFIQIPSHLICHDSLNFSLAFVLDMKLFSYIKRNFFNDVEFLALIFHKCLRLPRNTHKFALTS